MPQHHSTLNMPARIVKLFLPSVMARMAGASSARVYVECQDRQNLEDQVGCENRRDLSVIVRWRDLHQIGPDEIQPDGAAHQLQHLVA